MRKIGVILTPGFYARDGDPGLTFLPVVSRKSRFLGYIPRV